MTRMQQVPRLILFYATVVGLFILGTVLGNQAVTVIAEQVPVPRKHTIILDPGHGGEDGGAISCTNKRESVFNLDISLRLNDLLHLLGYQTIMTRMTDTAIYTGGETIAQKKVSDLKNRVNIVNSTPDAILLSIHQNDFPERQYQGAQVFYASSEESKDLAQRIQDIFIATINQGSNRKIKEGSSIYLLKKSTIPSVLVECGFLSNPSEEARLSDPNYQKKMCCILASSVCGFISSLDRNSIN